MIKRGVQALLKQFGYRLVPASDSVVPNCGLSNLFPLIKKFGFDPKHIVDVGANHGSWTREAEQYFPRARSVCAWVAPLETQSITMIPRVRKIRRIGLDGTVYFHAN